MQFIKATDTSFLHKQQQQQRKNCNKERVREHHNGEKHAIDSNKKYTY